MEENSVFSGGLGGGRRRGNMTQQIRVFWLQWLVT